MRWLKLLGSFIHYFKTACVIYITDASSRAYKKQLIFYTSKYMKDHIFGLQRKISRHDWLLQLCTQLKQLWNYILLYTIFTLIIHQIVLLTRDWPKRITWPNIPQLKLGNIREYFRAKWRHLFMYSPPCTDILRTSSVHLLLQKFHFQQKKSTDCLTV